MMELSANWNVCSTEAGQHENPDWMKDASLTPLLPASVPGTVAQLLLDSNPTRALESLADLDEFDWWYTTDFEFSGTGSKHSLVFDGLATLTDIWFNGEKILSGNNMYLQYKVDVTTLLLKKNNLVICFRSLRRAFDSFKKRPRWKTKLVERQQLRWIRTSLLGYIPGWTPPVKPIGPWRGVWLESDSIATLSDLNLQTSFQDGKGILKIKASIDCHTKNPCELILEINGKSHGLFAGVEPAIHLEKEIIVHGAAPWMPHTHSKANLYPCKLMLRSGEQFQVLKEARVGFREVRLKQKDDLFQLQINGKPIFARGAVWTINDIVTLNGSRDNLRSALVLAHNAGMNMLRVGGTMVYEQDEFYNLCDELGIMVWQDFMFANMDYPVGDENFHAGISAEAAHQIKRLQCHPCVVVYCGNSEIEQQAAMLGIPSEMWRNEWFDSELPELIHTLHENTIYVPSTPSGGVLPFYTSTGVTHYYGVGAYLRDINDVRMSDVKFTPECLGFSNVPENKTISNFMGNRIPVTNDPLWKSRVPKDSGTDWDFEDVRDHYLQELFDIDPIQLRSTDMQRYLTLSRVASGEMMSRVFSEWRSTQSKCSGGLVWFYKDLWPGAGWGLLDNDNNPKAAYYFLKRVFQPLSLLLTDEGLQGLNIHLINESPALFAGRVEFQMLHDGNVNVAKASREITLRANEKLCLSAEDLLGGFYDTSYAYRFGPPKHEVACASLKDTDGILLSRQFHFPLNKLFPDVEAEVSAFSEIAKDGFCHLSISTNSFLYAVQIECEGFLPEDNFFHLMPGEIKQVALHQLAGASPPSQIHVRSANLRDVVNVAAQK
ncbi:MAG: glycoside hydrolase family 2 protein [Anaerolineales bacterium]|nr:glycoside hydrolase family 2 protein [Anaerolineales bacterium]